MENSTVVLAPVLEVGSSFVLSHTSYKGWSGKVYGKGIVSGASAVASKNTVSVTRITEKAILVTREDGYETWLPKSKVAANATGGYTVSKGFCYFISGLTWKQASAASYSFRRATML